MADTTLFNDRHYTVNDRHRHYAVNDRHYTVNDTTLFMIDTTLFNEMSGVLTMAATVCDNTTVSGALGSRRYPSSMQSVAVIIAISPVSWGRFCALVRPCNYTGTDT